jgi:hypothetical protein
VPQFSFAGAGRGLALSPKHHHITLRFLRIQCEALQNEALDHDIDRALAEKALVGFQDDQADVRKIGTVE